MWSSLLQVLFLGLFIFYYTFYFNLKASFEYRSFENLLHIEKKKAIWEINMVVPVAVKLGVGVALAIAAHFVLVKRWNNGKIKLSLN